MRKFFWQYIWVIVCVPGMPVCLSAQFKYDSSFIQPHTLPNYATIDFQHTGSGLHFYNKNDGIVHGPVYPFESALGIGVNVTYKFITLGYMQTVHNKVNRSAFVLGTTLTLGAWEFAANYTKYKNLAILEPQQNKKFPVSIKYSSFSSEVNYNFNAKRYSTRAVLYGEKIQRRSAGAFMLSVIPVYRYLNANTENGKTVVPDNAEFRPYFGQVAGLREAKFFNLDIRPGYSYTWAFKNGLYFLSAGAMLGTGLGYHNMNTETEMLKGWHWQASGKFTSSAGYNGPRVFAIIQYRYSSSISMINPALISVEEGTVRISLGYRFGHLERAIPVSLY